MQTSKQTSPHHVRRKFLAASEAYVESVGKKDMETLGTVQDTPDGHGTVVRLIMGATTLMPLRAVSYVDTAVRIARLFPVEQLQIIHANCLGEMVNGVDKVRSRQQADLLALVVDKHLQKVAPDMKGRTLHAEDTPLDIKPFIPLAQQALQASPVGELLQRKGAKHGGDAVHYAAAHCAFQDTDQLNLRALVPSQPDQTRAERIVSIGCQQERNFYLARMAMRSLCTSTSFDLVPTAQIFTRHVSPPYFLARSGEQTLESALVSGIDLALAGDTSSRRDLEHTLNLVKETSRD